MRCRYRRHAGAKFRLLNEQFIELFDVDLASHMRPLEPLLQAACMAAWEGQEEGPQVTPRVASPRAWQVNIPLTAPPWLRWCQPAALDRTKHSA